MKKIMLVLMLLLVLVSAACAKENDEYTGTVMLYTSAGENVARAFKELFEAKYPNVTLEYYAGNSGNCSAKLSGEFEAGKVACDVIWLAEPSGLIDFKNQERLVKYNSPFAKAVPPEFKDPAGYFTGARILIMGLAYSKTAVSGIQIPTNFEGLLDPAFKKGIIMSNPNSAGSAKAWVYGLTHNEKYGWDFFEKLSKQNVVFDTSANAVNQNIAEGKYKIAVSPEHSTLNQVDQGAAIGYQPTDDVLAISCPIAIPVGCPNEELAKLLYDFILDPEGGQGALPSFNITPIIDGVELPEWMKSASEITKSSLPVDWEDLAEIGNDMMDQFNMLFK
ncbi:MAG: extracellular solute-binding protein [Anaerolineaceae bacterium]|nr:extracellular solute-binding protein [Anaerolineaceae bacterium]